MVDLDNAYYVLSSIHKQGPCKAMPFRDWVVRVLDSPDSLRAHAELYLRVFEFESEREECQRIQRVMKRHGKRFSLGQAQELWQAKSLDCDAGWLTLPPDDEDLWAACVGAMRLVRQYTIKLSHDDIDVLGLALASLKKCRDKPKANALYDRLYGLLEE